MANRLITIWIGLFAMLTASTSHADGDKELGRELAEELCVRCHNIGANGPFKQYPPSFAAIAVYRSVDDIYARIEWPPLHANMPQFSDHLTTQNVDNLVAYITSLGDK
jgi:mono/diheme cytochrome c family protein